MLHMHNKNIISMSHKKGSDNWTGFNMHEISEEVSVWTEKNELMKVSWWITNEWKWHW